MSLQAADLVESTDEAVAGMIMFRNVRKENSTDIFLSLSLWSGEEYFNTIGDTL